METRRLRAGIVLLLAVVALGAAGAAVDSGSAGGGSTGLGEGSGSGVGSGQSGIFGLTPEFHPFFDGGILALLIGVGAIAGVVAAVVGGVLAAINWDWETFKERLVSTSLRLGVLGLLAVGFYLLIQLFDGLPSGGGSSGIGGTSDVQGAGEAASETGLQLPAVLGIAIVAVLLLFVVARTLGAGEDEEEPTVEGAIDPGRTATDSGGDAMASANVGRASADNEVYRAWLALAREAGADARRETPAEVADRAVASGVDEAATREITSLFESVRYGGREPSDALEQRAKRARARVAGDR